MKRREPPYDEFFDRHRALLRIVLIAFTVLAALAIVGAIGIVISRA